MAWCEEQGLHLVLALEWAVQATRDFDERDRAATLLAVLCHDLGKSDTPPEAFPHHKGHEGGGIPHIEQLQRRWPGLLDQRTATLCKHVAALHLLVRHCDELRHGTLARIYDEHFRAKDYPLEPFVTAVAADSAGRLGREQDGPRVAEKAAGGYAKFANLEGESDESELVFLTNARVEEPDGRRDKDALEHYLTAPPRDWINPPKPKKKGETSAPFQRPPRVGQTV